MVNMLVVVFLFFDTLYYNNFFSFLMLVSICYIKKTFWLTYPIFAGCTAIAVVQSVEVWLPMSCGGKAILFGIQSGFLASLTTVSSFVGEIVALRRQRREKQSTAASYFYIFITVFLCLLVSTVINVINLYFLKQEYYREAMSLPLNITFFEWKHSFTLNCLTWPVFSDLIFTLFYSSSAL